MSYILLLCLLGGSALCQGQDKKLPDDPKTSTWEKEKDLLNYKRAEDYSGPEEWNSSEPTDIRDERFISNDKLQRRMYGGGGSGSGSSGSPYYGGGSSRRGTIKYKPQQVQRQRQKNFKGFNRGGGNGTLKYDPKVKRPEPADRPNPRVRPKRRSSNSPSLRSSSSGSVSSGGSGFFTVLLVILGIVLVVLILYFLLRNKKPADTKIVVDVEDEWNPEVVTKSELELKLEAAMEREDFRECIRIYFTFILKELIKKGWIRWKKDKTNHHYVMEMGGREGSLGFMECVRVYDLVWYGEYQIDREIFEMLQPTLMSYYKSIESGDEQ